MRDLVAFQTRCQRCVAVHGWRGADAEDLVSTMVLEALEHPARVLSVDLLYLHAWDRLDPRGAAPDGGPRGRRSQQRQALTPALLQTLVAPGPTPAEAWAAQADAGDWLAGLSGDDAWLVVWYYGEGHTLAAIGAALGVTESRVSQRLTAVQRQWRTDA